MTEEKIEGLNKKLLKLKEYVDLFRTNLGQYQSKNYDESNTRTDFIDKFFELLDWDVRNEQHFEETRREVIREDKITIQGKQKAPDYCFRIGGARKFFVEAKKPSINVKEDIGAAYQVRRYGYSAKLPLSILTDFDEFAVYDTRIKPKPRDKAEVARIFYWKFTDYEKEFENIYNIFSKNAILKGSFDKFVVTSKKKKGTSEVDKEFLKLIEDWRSDLAKNIAINNPKIDLYNLNAAVQKIIDRIIFLRIAEDRNIEEYNNLFKIAQGENIYKKLGEYFERSQKKYDSGLFVVESWLSNLKIDDKIFKDIIKSLYFPESPYEFSVLPVEILGNIYEQFLGKVITLTPSHQAKVEEKPEVKKAGGVYYTPQYIVQYIVKNTVGEKIKNLTPAQVEKLKILDPACGSGSFLIGAYDYLMNWHLSYYADPKRKADSAKKGKIYHYADGDFRLSVAEKKKILLNNIFGVDIDNQAVEVTKLSLLLKLMENETQESAGMLFKYSNEALLPDLKNNIKCGNSLIGPDFYADKNLSLFGNNEMRKINVFDWQKEFKEIFANGRFDVVIGNPPYVDNRGFDKNQLEYFFNNYVSFTKSGTDKFKTKKFNTFIAFIEIIAKLLRQDGLAGYIIHKNLLKTTAYKGSRIFILNNFSINKIIDWGANQFEGVVAETISLFLKKTKKTDGKIKIEFFKKDKKNRENDISQKLYEVSFDNIFSINLLSEDMRLIDKIEKDKCKLFDFVNINNGVVTGDDKHFIFEKKIDNNYKKCITGKNIKRYYVSGLKGYVNYDLKKLLRARDPKIFESKEKLIMQMININLIVCYDDQQLYNLGTSYDITTKSNELDLKYLLGLLNSKLLNYYYQKKFTNESALTNAISTKNLFEFPIPSISGKDQQNIIDTVNQMLEVQKKFHSAKTEADKKIYQQKIDILDKQIDQEVYKLYGLTAEEIRIIEK